MDLHWNRCIKTVKSEESMKKIAETSIRVGTLAVALALSACGGGGGGGAASGSNDSAGPVAAQRTVSGTAAKGLLKGATVAVYAIDAQGVRASQATVTTLTASDGTYSIKLPATLLNFVIEVGTAPGATMADEATGQDIPLPAGFKLRSVIGLADAATTTYQAAVSPFTEMIARTAETAGGGKLTSQAVGDAKTAIRTLLGFDPETVQPVNANSDAAATATEAQKNQSLMLAALSQMARNSSADCAQSGAAERIACVVDKVAGAVSVKDGTPALSASSQAGLSAALAQVAEDAKINRTGKHDIVGVPVLVPTPKPEKGDDSGSKPAPPTPTVPATPVSGVDAAKILFGSLRTNLQSIDANNALTDTVARIRDDLENGIAPAGGDVANTVVLMESAAAYLQRYRSDTTLPTDLAVRAYHATTDGFYPYGPNNAPGYGTCKVQAEPLAIKCRVVSSGYRQSYSTGPYSYTQAYSQRVFTLTPQAGDATKLDYVARLEKATVTMTWNGVRNVPATPVVTPVGTAALGTLTYATSTAGDLVQIGIKGAMPGRLDNGGAVVEDSETWDVAASRVSQGNNLYQYNFGATLAALKDGRTVGTMAIDPASHLRLNIADLANGRVAPDAANELLVVVSGGTGATSVNGKLKLSNTKTDKNGEAMMPTALSFEGALQHNGSTVLSGGVSIVRRGYEAFDSQAPESSTNFVKDAVAVTGSLSVPNRPQIGINVGVSRVAFDGADLNVQYRDGTSVVNASVSAVAGNAAPVVSVSSASGVQFTFANAKEAVNVTKDGAVVAKLDLAKGMVYYADGKFESLK